MFGQSINVRTRTLFAGLVIGFVLAVNGSVCFGNDTLEPVSIETPGGSIVFSSEVMRTEAEREKGLMLRPYLPELRGMLFAFGEVRTVQMWMKDTLIPLDMVFIRANGTIARVTANTEPYSTRVLSSGEPVSAVLEINGGLAAKYGIKVGAHVTHPLFKR
jgi:uncharacterized membrane protein (UPF0127 family)